MTQQSEEVQADDLVTGADDVLAATGILRNQYFTALDSGEMSLATFQRTQRQFYFAVDFFSRPMSALLMRIPRADLRLGILENVVEEHGNFQAAAFHEATFRQFLDSIGGDSSPPDPSQMRPPVHAFNSTIMSACLSDDIDIGVACLGIIEHAFADISALIGQAVVRRRWLRGEDLIHYKVHAEIDKQHAADFFRLLQPHWECESRRAAIMQGLRLGAYAFDRLYRDLLED